MALRNSEFSAWLQLSCAANECHFHKVKPCKAPFNILKDNLSRDKGIFFNQVLLRGMEEKKTKECSTKGAPNFGTRQSTASLRNGVDSLVQLSKPLSSHCRIESRYVQTKLKSVRELVRQTAETHLM